MTPDPEERAAWDRRTLTIAAIVVLALIAAGLLIYGLSADRTNQDRLSDSAMGEAQPTNLERQCGSQKVHDAIKRELFRRAAQARGRDQEALEQIAGQASARMEAAMMTSEDDDRGTISCSGLLWVDIPPAYIAPGGRRTLSGDVDYTIETSSEGAGDLVSLGGGDAIITALSRLARVRAVQEQPEIAVDPTIDLTNQIFPPAGVPVPQPAPAPTEPEITGANPSFDCDFARSRSEIAVCNNVGLASLDREMAGLYEQSLAQADGEQRELLQRTRKRFLAYRDRCRSESCIAGAYQGRMREIRDIMAGRWRSSR